MVTICLPERRYLGGGRDRTPAGQHRDAGIDDDDAMKWVSRAVAVVMLAATTSGCAVRVGDSNLVDDWTPLVDATPYVPPSGVCYSEFTLRASQIRSPVNLVPCDQRHAVETFHVGRFPDTVAVLPAVRTADYWYAFDECEKQAKEFLGDDWFNGRLYLGVGVPQLNQWEGGGRWFRCHLAEVFTVRDDTVARTSSLRDALRGTAPLAQRCVDVVDLTDTGWSDLTVVDCAAPHDAEYAGAFKVPGTQAPTDEQTDRVFEGCRNVVARYLGGTVNGIRVGFLAWGTDGERWKYGDRWVRCYAWNDRKMKGSVKGIGNKAPPT
jgi:hypothetical protein